MYNLQFYLNDGWRILEPGERIEYDDMWYRKDCATGYREIDLRLNKCIQSVNTHYQQRDYLKIFGGGVNNGKDYFILTQRKPVTNIQLDKPKGPKVYQHGM